MRCSSKAHLLSNKPLVGCFLGVSSVEGAGWGWSLQGSEAVVLLTQLQMEVPGTAFLHMKHQNRVLGAVPLC